MLDAALTALSGLLDPWMLLTLLIGVLAGLVLGMIPGLGGTGSMAILLPFVFLLEPQQALALVIGAAAVIHTSDTISAVLLGIPGSASSSVALLDGHTMAKQGQASRALSVAFVSSAAGGLIGALGLTVSIVAARPLVLLFGSPELFMLTVLGISLASLLSRGNIAKGLLAASFGLLLGQIGVAPASAEYRYTFGSLFLTEGLDLVAVALGVFGLAEIMSLVARRTSVAQGVELGGGWGQGVRDVLRHWTHVVRGSLVGIWTGILPGVGATAGAWLAYGQAAATAKDKRRFGKGDPRGVAAPEGASNAISAGDLIPTLLFGIPGSAAAALLLGALLVFGVEPGPSLISEDLDLVYTIVWSFSIAAVLGALVCFVLAGPLAKLSFVRFPILAAGLTVIMFVSSFQAAQEFGVLQIMLLLGVIGWLMKMCDYPRAPFLIGFVLSVPLERYYFLTVNLYSPAEWMSRPAVVVMFALLVAPLVYRTITRVRRRAAERRRVTAGAGAPAERGEDADATGEQTTDAPADTGSGTGAEPEADETPTGPASETLFRGTLWPVGTAAFFVVLFAFALLVSQQFTPSGRLVPQLVCGAGLALSALVTTQEWLRWRRERHGAGTGWRTEVGWTGYAFGWLCLFLAITYAVGTLLASAVFVPVFLRVVAGLRYRAIAVYTVVLLVALYLMQAAAGMELPPGWFMPAFLA